MFNNYFRERKKKKRREEFNSGYDYAAGALLRGEISVGALSEDFSEGELTGFDLGILSAISELKNRRIE